jgi:hypothetical protein
MAKRETVDTLRKKLAATTQELRAARNPYARTTLTSMFDECLPPIASIGRSREECERICKELCQSPAFCDMVECCDPDTVGYVITDAIRVGMEMGKRLNEAQKLEEMVGYREDHR